MQDLKLFRKVNVQMKKTGKTMTDTALIEMYLDGDMGAFNRLVRKWQTPVYNFICRYLGDDSESADISQNIFIKVYKNIHGLQDNSKFKSWLFQITANQCKDHIRKRRYNVSIADEYDEDRQEVIHIPVDREESQPERLTRGNNSDILNKAMQALPEEQRIIIVLKEYHGLKFSEIAGILETSENTIKSRMYTGLKNIRKVLNNWGISKEDLIYEMQ